MEGATRILVKRDADIVLVCQRARSLAADLKFSGNDQVALVIAISEIARNIILYAGEGEIFIKTVFDGDTPGICIVARDQGAGISDVSLALQDGYSTGGGLGVGLPGARRLMDEFEIDSKVGQGTTVAMIKWNR
ncbi:MAG: anti-sigma regulatory factor [Anaerolineae bacterium]|nr:anti-sigma regulatory factor [Anaerolineae bacterium]